MTTDNTLPDDEFFDDDEDTQKDKYLTFQLENEEYAIEIICVIEVIGMQKIAPIPDMPDFVKGVINLRGQVIPVVDVRLRFGIQHMEYTERTCILVVKMKDTFIGLIVDTVCDVVTIPEEDIDDPPKLNRKKGSRFIQGLGKIDDDVKIILNVHKLLYDEEYEIVTELDI